MALDFTTASLDSRVTFTRALDTATRVNSSGNIESVLANVARFDFDPVALSCKGLLIEESRTNIALYSNDFKNTAAAGATRPWVWTRATVSSNVVGVTSPDGTENASKLIEDTTASSTHTLSQNISVTSGLAYTVTQFFKAAERGFAALLFSGTPFGSNGVTISLSTGAITQSIGTLDSTAVVTQYANGWFRVSITKTAASTAAGGFQIRIALNGTTSSYTGDGTSGIYVYGGQLEAGAFATSYIPTEATAVTRNADVATMTGTNFSDWYSAGAGGVVARVLPSTVSGTRPALQFDDATADEIIALRGNTTNPELVIVDGGSPQAQIDAGTIAANTAYNLGAAWNTDNCAAAVNGGAAVTDTSATIPTVTQARLGSDGTNYLNGHIQTLRYWPQRIINAEVQAFSK
jgi:hypothetical protein